MHWEKEQKQQKTPTSGWVEPYLRSSSINIEMTGYALLAMIGDGRDNDVLLKAGPIVKWLSHQRNALGGFSSTQVLWLKIILKDISWAKITQLPFPY